MEKQIFLNNEPTYYYITPDGRLHNRKTNNWYKGSISGGYLKYDLRWNTKKYTCFAHRLVATYYIDNLDNLPVVNHKDGNKLNNNIENLEWVTYSENNLHAYETGLKERTNGVNNIEKYVSDLEGEEWKQYEDSNYMISNLGRIRNIKTGNLLKGKITGKGYVEWCLSIDKKKHSVLAHRLIYAIFKEPLKERYVINHIDGDKQNNKIENLEQVVPSQNIKHSYYAVGHKNVRQVGKFSLDDVLLDVYPSCAEAARQNEGCRSNAISAVCLNKMNTHHGFKWKYMEE